MIWQYILFAFVALIAISVLEVVGREVVKAWHSLADMNLSHTPHNILLYLYCQYEASSRINMEATMENIQNLRRQK
jgi:hypothetical protein